MAKQDTVISNSTNLTTPAASITATFRNAILLVTSKIAPPPTSPIKISSKFLKTKTNTAAQSSTFISPSTTYFTTTEIKTHLLHTTHTSQIITPSSAIINLSSSVIPTSAFSNGTITPILTPTSRSSSSNALLYVGLPALIVGFILLVMLYVWLWHSYKRKQQRQKDFTPCYTYDQTENEITDGVLYPSETASADLFCVDASPVVGRHDICDDDDESCLLGSHNTPNNNELNDMASLDVRCDSIAV